VTWVNLKQIDLDVESRIMALIRSQPNGMSILMVQRYFEVGGLQSNILNGDVPSWLDLSPAKRRNRLNRIIRSMVKAGKARIERNDEGLDIDSRYGRAGWNVDRMLPLTVLDRIVAALAQDEGN